jgi:hypothetical protein
MTDIDEIKKAEHKTETTQDAYDVPIIGPNKQITTQKHHIITLRRIKTHSHYELISLILSAVKQILNLVNKHSEEIKKHSDEIETLKVKK